MSSLARSARAAGGVGADARAHLHRARRAADRASEDIRRDVADQAEQLAAVEDPAARNAHYEVLWDLIIDGSKNVAYRLALTTLVAGQQIASVGPEAVAAELSDVRAIRALARAVAEGDADIAHARARELLERSIPEE